MALHEKTTRELVEEKGRLFEHFDLTPMQGRIVAYFTISDTPDKTFDDLVKFFDTSKSSISSSLNFLLLKKIIDYRTEHGGFKTVDEIKEVPGIGDAKFAAMQGSIAV